MIRRFPLYAMLALVSAMGFSSCNDDDDSGALTGMDDSSDYAVMVTSFKLSRNDSVLANLDSVFFSIDLDNAVVFNADSLPMGTKVNRLPVEMTLYNVKKAEIVMPGSKGADTTVNYLTNSADSIDFSRGSVKLKLTSANEKVTRTYTIFVNVHKLAPDSMAWGRVGNGQLPTNLSAPVAQKALEYDGKVMCFVSDGTECTRAWCEDPAADNWTIESVSLPAGGRVESMVAGESEMYMIDGDNALWSSTDGGLSWSATSAEMTHIYGVYEDKVLGVKRDAAGKYFHVSYPATTEVAVAPDCPVEGTSDALTYTTQWAVSPMMLVMGGITATGEYVGGMWGFDGNEWAATTIDGIQPVAGVSVIPYFTFRTNSIWQVTKHSVLLAFGGRMANGKLSRTVYVSSDRGVHWAKAGVSLQLPAEVPSFYGAQALVVDRSLNVSSRAVTPITEWECPFVYVFGGYNALDTLNDAVWRGVINRLMFKPLQ